MKLTKLTEPSEIVLEHLLLGTDKIEQFAIIGRLARQLGCRIEGNAADEIGMRPRALTAEAKRRQMPAHELVEALMDRIIEHNLFNSILR